MFFHEYLFIDYLPLRLLVQGNLVDHHDHYSPVHLKAKLLKISQFIK